MTCGILVPQPVIEPVPLAVRTWSPNHWTIREFLEKYFKSNILSIFKELKKIISKKLNEGWVKCEGNQKTQPSSYKIHKS